MGSNRIGASLHSEWQVCSCASQRRWCGSGVLSLQGPSSQKTNEGHTSLLSQLGQPGICDLLAALKAPELKCYQGTVCKCGLRGLNDDYVGTLCTYGSV